MPTTLGELADRFDCKIRGNPEIIIDSVGTLLGATPNAISFLSNPAYIKQLKTTSAGAVILEERHQKLCPVPALVANNPYAVYARVAEFLHTPKVVIDPYIHPTACISEDAKVADSSRISAHAVIGPGAEIGESVVISEGCIVGANVKIGSKTRLAPHVVLMPGVEVGKRCIFHSGVVCGSDGFGFAHEDESWIKVPQLGGIVIGDDVEIGANTTVDRGTIENTVIEDGVKLDNLIQIGHNVHIGAHTVMAALCGIAGSTVIGRRCMFGGAVVAVGHLKICDDAVFTFHSTILQSVTEPGTYSGALSVDKSPRWRRNAARFKTLDSLTRFGRGTLEKETDE